MDDAFLVRGQELRLALEACDAIGIVDDPSDRTLIATSRPSFVSLAR